MRSHFNDIKCPRCGAGLDSSFDDICYFCGTVPDMRTYMSTEQYRRPDPPKEKEEVCRAGNRMGAKRFTGEPTKDCGECRAQETCESSTWEEIPF